MSVLTRRDSHGRLVGYFAVVNYRDADGNRRQMRKNATGKTEKAQERDAERIEREFLNKRDAGELPGQRRAAPRPAVPLTVAAYLNQWLAGSPGKAGETTLLRYRSLLDHVKREIGSMLLTDVTPIHVRQVYASIRARGLSAKTALNVHRIWRTAFTDAHEIDHLIAESPVAKKLAPSAPEYKVNPPTPDETRRIIEAARSTPLAMLVAVAAWTGARQGELLALRWDDVDLDGGTISIKHSKRDTGRRRIPLTPATVELLREQRLQQLKQQYDLTDPETGRSAWQDTGLVFTNALGARISDGMIRRTWLAICSDATKKAKEEDQKASPINCRFHDLRHGFATFLLGQNVHPKIVSSLLGHSRITITLDTYSHVIPALGLEAQAIASLDKALVPHSAAAGSYSRDALVSAPTETEIIEKKTVSRHDKR